LGQAPREVAGCRHVPPGDQYCALGSSQRFGPRAGLPGGPPYGELRISSTMNTQNCGMNSSLKFSYWSSPKITMTSGLNSSTAARTLRTPAANLSQCLAAALAPSSSPHSACIGGGQFFGSLSRSGTRGLVMDRFTMDIDGPGRYANGGKGLSPTPRISPIRFPSGGCAAPGIGSLHH